ncbi:MAG: hypothetical protein AB7S36_05605 [Planctomycetota bacterium]
MADPVRPSPDIAIIDIGPRPPRVVDGALVLQPIAPRFGGMAGINVVGVLQPINARGAAIPAAIGILPPLAPGAGGGGLAPGLPPLGGGNGGNGFNGANGFNGVGAPPGGVDWDEGRDNGAGGNGPIPPRANGVNGNGAAAAANGNAAAANGNGAPPPPVGNWRGADQGVPEFFEPHNQRVPAWQPLGIGKYWVDWVFERDCGSKWLNGKMFGREVQCRIEYLQAPPEQGVCLLPDEALRRAPVQVRQRVETRQKKLSEERAEKGGRRVGLFFYGTDVAPSSYQNILEELYHLYQGHAKQDFRNISVDGELGHGHSSTAHNLSAAAEIVGRYLCEDPDTKFDLFGYSRGAVQAVMLPRILHEIGVCCAEFEDVGGRDRDQRFWALLGTHQYGQQKIFPMPEAVGRYMWLPQHHRSWFDQASIDSFRTVMRESWPCCTPNERKPGDAYLQTLLATGERKVWGYIGLVDPVSAQIAVDGTFINDEVTTDLAKWADEVRIFVHTKGRGAFDGRDWFYPLAPFIPQNWQMGGAVSLGPLCGPAFHTRCVGNWTVEDLVALEVLSPGGWTNHGMMGINEEVGQMILQESRRVGVKWAATDFPNINLTGKHK